MTSGSTSLVVAGLVCGGYLLGAVPTGLWLARRAGIDLRRRGSGNVGATNVARTLGAQAGLAVLAADVGKGALAVWLAVAAGVGPGARALTGLAAFLGHLYPPFAGFRGGKGVATAAGVFAVLDLPALAAALAVFVAVAAWRRIVSLASLAAAGTLPLVAGIRAGAAPEFWAAMVMAALIFWRHRENLRRLRAGTEPTFRFAGRGSGGPPVPGE